MKLTAHQKGRTMSIHRDGKHWFSHRNPEKFKGMLVAHLSMDQLIGLVAENT